MAQTVKLRRSASPGTPPTTSQLALGELAINTYDGKLFLKKNVSGTESIVEIGANNLADTFHVYEYSVSSNTTVFSGADDNSHTLSYTTGSPPRIAVYLNGLLLDWGTDFTATNGTSVTLTSAAVSGDLVQIQAYKSTVVAGSNLMFADSIKAQFGDDGDLEIHHDGSNSYIADVGTGSLNIDTNGLGMSFRHTGSNPAKNMAQMTQYGVTLNYDGTTKLTTTAAGATITGALTTSGSITAGGDIIADDSNSTTNPTITFDGHTDSGFSISDYGNGTDQINIIRDGGAMALINQAGITSNANVYTASTSAFRNYGGTWAGTTGVAGNGFYFLNTANSNTTKAMELSHDGSVLFPGEIRSNTRLKSDMITGIQQTGSFIDFDDDTTYGTNGVTVSSLSTLSLMFDTNNNDSHTFDVYGNGQSTAYLTIDNNGDLSILSAKLTFKEITGSDNYTQIKKTNTGSNLALVSQESIYMMLDGNDDQTNRSFQIKKNADAPGSGSALFVVEENGNVTSYANVASATMSTTGDTDFGGRGDFAKDLRIRGDGGTGNLGVVRFSTNSNNLLMIDPANDGNNAFTFSSSGDLTVPGNLTVNGSTTTLNTATLTVDDLNITVADGAASASAANGAGLTVAGANATLTYDSTQDRWNMNKGLELIGTPLVIGTGTTDVGRFENQSGAASLYAYTNRAIKFGNDTNGTHMYIAGDGDIGFGTSSPTADGIHLVKDNPVIRIQEGDVTNGYGEIRFNSTSLRFRSRNNTSHGSIRFEGNNGTDTVEFARFNQAGNLGIGVNNPSSPLHIQNDADYLANFKSTDTTAGIILTDSGSQARMLNSNGHLVFLADRNNEVGSSSIRFNLDTAAFSASDSTMLLNSTGLGIGTSSPGSMLDITMPNLAGGNTGNGITVSDDGADLKLEIRKGTGGVNADRRLALYEDGGNYPLYLQEEGGNVGIGVPVSRATRAKLDVNGSINIETASSIALDQDTYTDTAILIPRGTFIRSNTTGDYQRNLIGHNGTTGNGSLQIGQQGTSIITDIIMYPGSSGNIRFYGSGSEDVRFTSNGRVGIGNTSPKARLQVEEYGIETTETSTSATTQTAIHTMSASDFRSARFTIQVTNSTDSTYHTTEILMVHDGTTANITEFGKVFTANEEATFTADISSGNVRLLATPATTDSMEFKVVCHSITV